MSDDVERVGPAEAARRMDEEGWVYLDVRSVPEFELGHPDGAYNVPLAHLGPAGMEPNPEFLDVVARSFAKDTKLVLGCKSGDRSLRAARQLREAGYAAVCDQRAGFGGVRDPFGGMQEKGWMALGLPTASEAREGRSWEALRGSGSH